MHGVCRVQRCPGLLLQQFRQVAHDQLSFMQLGNKPFEGYTEEEQAIAVAAMMELLVRPE